jgi:hypothetical protein
MLSISAIEKAKSRRRVVRESGRITQSRRMTVACKEDSFRSTLQDPW